tara:strand:+ start:124 stop:579 length:456 start_codon:yes stop_codon:yes gene_type:complete
MIITCPSCEKKFELDANLVPDDGRMLQCGSCNHAWFFRKAENEETMIKPIKLESNLSDNIGEIVINEELDYPKKQTKNRIQNKSGNNNSNFNLFKIFNYFIVLIISLIALIILLDTFKNNLTSIFPNLELFLYNLFESIRDIKLFINDLVR